jgi:hypothetical protein
MTQTLTDAQIKLSHTIDDSEKMRTKVVRASKEIDRIIPDLRHAIEHGRTAAALDMLVTLDRYHLTIADAVKLPK